MAREPFDFWTQMLPGLVVFGLGLSITVSPLTAAILAAVDPAQSGIGSAINNAVSRIAGLIAIAFTGVIIPGRAKRRDRQRSRFRGFPAGRAGGGGPVRGRRAHLRDRHPQRAVRFRPRVTRERGALPRPRHAAAGLRAALTLSATADAAAAPAARPRPRRWPRTAARRRPRAARRPPARSPVARAESSPARRRAAGRAA